jgi:hypothetical protein
MRKGFKTAQVRVTFTGDIIQQTAACGQLLMAFSSISQILPRTIQLSEEARCLAPKRLITRSLISPFSGFIAKDRAQWWLLSPGLKRDTEQKVQPEKLS